MNGCVPGRPQEAGLTWCLAAQLSPMPHVPRGWPDLWFAWEKKCSDKVCSSTSQPFPIVCGPTIPRHLQE